MASTFQKIHDKAERAGIVPNTEKSREWFIQNLKNIRNLSQAKLLNDDLLIQKKKPLIGRMFQYFYDPIGKDSLPFYDEFPLIIMVEPAPGGFYGLNLHYLSPKLRAVFFDELLTRMKEGKDDEQTRLVLTYSFLKASRKLRLFAPCFKRYRNDRIKSRVVQILPSEWELALFLPTDSFVGMDRNKIWKESRTYL